MARVTAQALPPSLQDAYQDLVGDCGGKRVGLILGAHAPRRTLPDRRDGAIARRAAAWLAERWRSALDPHERSAFYLARRAEIEAGSFPATYWRSLTQFSDHTQRSLPYSVSAWTKPIEPAYQDPLRLPSKLRYKYTDNAYPTPAGDGAGTSPAPGWQGAVTGGRFEDQWHAQQRPCFNLHYPTWVGDTRPLVVRLVTDIEGRASTRGHRAWFAVTREARCLRVGETFSTLGGLAYVYWNPTLATPVEIPEDDPEGWTHALTLVHLKDLAGVLPPLSTAPYNRLILTVSTPPALGRYFARNDWVRVVHHTHATAYQARTPTD